MKINGFISNRGVGIRRYRLAVPSVGCVNHTLERVVQLDPTVRILTHQNGCGMLKDDVEQIRATLAGVLANPNVERGVVVGLGCESNQSADVEDLARAQFVNVTSVVLQDFGGVEPTSIEIARRLSADRKSGERLPISPSAIRVLVMTRDDAGPAGSLCVEELARQLRVEGFQVIGPVAASSAATSARAGLGVPEIWEGAHRTHAPTEIEVLSIAAAQGVILAVAVAGEAGPIGSPIMPVIRVATSPDWAHTSDYVWKPDHPPAIQEILSLLEEVANGRQTLGESFGQRDFTPPRVSPTM